MTDRELLQMAFDALNNFDKGNHGMRWQVPVIKALRAALAQPEPWVKTYSGGKPNYTEPCERCGEVNPAEIHTCTPKQREWQGLTDEELLDIADMAYANDLELLQTLQTKLKEKNSTTEKNIQTSDKND